MQHTTLPGFSVLVDGSQAILHYFSALYFLGEVAGSDVLAVEFVGHIQQTPVRHMPCPNKTPKTKPTHARTSLLPDFGLVQKALKHGLFWQRGQLGTIQRVGKPEHPCCQHANVPKVEVVDVGRVLPPIRKSPKLHKQCLPYMHIRPLVWDRDQT